MDDPEIVRRWRGISVFDSQRRARFAASRRPYLGRFVAKLHLGTDSTIESARTGGTGHYTPWGTPKDLLAAVVEVTPIAEETTTA